MYMHACQSVLVTFSHLIYGYFYSYFTDEVMICLES